jgi:hypothetical protein
MFDESFIAGLSAPHFESFSQPETPVEREKYSLQKYLCRVASDLW